MIYESFIHSSDYGSGEFETVLKFRALIFPGGVEQLMVEHGAKLVEVSSLSERDRNAIKELCQAQVRAMRELADAFHEERLALEKRWGA